MASDQLVSPKLILEALLELQRQGGERAMEELEKVEPELASYFMENSSAIHQKLLELVVRYDRPRAARSGGGRDGWQKLVIEDRRTSIPDLAAFRIDFSGWLKSWPKRERKIIGRLIAGEGTAEVAGRFGITPGRISQLRRRFERSWEQYQGEPAFN